MRAFTLFVFCLFSVVLFAQKSDLEIGLDIGADYPIVLATENTATTLKYANHQPRIGATIAVPLAEKWYLKSGISYWQRLYVHETQLTFLSEIDPIKGEHINDSNLPEYIHLKTYDYYLAVPIHVQYRFGNARFQPFMEGGIALNPYLHTKAITKLDDEPKEIHKRREMSAPKLPVSLELSAGMLWNISDKWAVKLQPTARYLMPKTARVLFFDTYMHVNIDLGVTMNIGRNWVDKQ